MQADRRLVEHEQRVDQRGAERGGEIDALDLAAGQRARLPVEGEIAEPDLIEITQARADLGEQQIGRLVAQHRQLEPGEQVAATVQRQQHEIVDREAGQRGERRLRPLDADGPEAASAGQQLVGVVARANAPQQRVGPQPRAAAGLARGVGTILREQHADVHLVALGLEPRKEAAHAVPDARPRFAPALPVRLAFEHPLALLVGELAPRHVERDAAFLGVGDQIVLRFAEAGRLPRLDRAVAERARFVRDDQPEVDADHAAEAAAGLARAHRRVERELARHRIGVLDVAVGAVQAGGEAPGFNRR